MHHAVMHPTCIVCLYNNHATPPLDVLQQPPQLDYCHSSVHCSLLIYALGTWDLVLTCIEMAVVTLVKRAMVSAIDPSRNVSDPNSGFSGNSRAPTDCRAGASGKAC